MSYQIQEFKVNNSSAYLTGVDFTLNDNKDTYQPVSCKSVYDEHIENILKHNALTNKFIVDYDHLCSIDSNGNYTSYTYNSNTIGIWNSLWVYILPNTKTILLNRGAASRYLFFNKISTDPKYFISHSSSNNTVPEGAVFCIISTKQSNFTNGYDNVFVIQNTSKEDTNAASKNYIINRNYGMSINSDSSNPISYVKNSLYDCLFVNLSDNTKYIEIQNLDNYSIISYFSNNIISKDNYIGYNYTGYVINGATFCAINVKKSIINEIIDYTNVRIIHKQNYLSNDKFIDIFKYNLKTIVTSKNYIDTTDLLYGYVLTNGVLEENVAGIFSNKLFLEENKTYTVQGCQYYGTYNALYIAHFDINDNYLSRTILLDTIKDDETIRIGHCTFTYSKPSNTYYSRILMRYTYDVTYDIYAAQLEEGDVMTEVSNDFNCDYLFENNDQEKNDSNKTINILSIGNSYSQDALSYVPFIMKNIAPDINMNIGILYQSGASLDQHYNNLLNETASYIYYKYTYQGDCWTTISNEYTITEALSDMNWNIILLQQGSVKSTDYMTYQPYLNSLINQLYSHINYHVKFGWMLTQSRPKVNNSTIFSDEEIIENYNLIAQNSKKVMDETLCEFLFPVGTAVQNARTTSLNEIGDYGKLCSSDGGHLQEGLPCQLAAYVCVLKLLELCGESYNSIFGDTTRTTSEWLSTKPIPGPNGTSVGVNDYNCKIAQMCAIMAIKHPYQITQMTDSNIV